VALLVRWIDRRAQREATRRDMSRRWITLGVALLIIAAPLVQLAALRVVKLDPFEALFDRAVDVAANSYFTAGLRLENIDEALRTYPQLMPTLDIHALIDRCFNAHHSRCHITTALRGFDDFFPSFIPS